MDSLKSCIQAFGFDVHEVDGHDSNALSSALSVDGPGLRVLILNTVKGNGVSFMENRLEWHYLPLTDELYARAQREVSSR